MAKKTSKYPAEEGWIKAKLSRVKGSQVPTEEEVKAFLVVGKDNIENYEWAEYKVFKTLIRVTFRKIRKDENDKK